MNELKQYLALLNKLSRVFPTLPNLAATEAVNFSKERFRDQNWTGTRTIAWPKRKTRGREKRKGRAILVDKAILKRDIHKISANPDRAIIGTSKLSSPYAKAHNEGFKGTVKVKEHRRKRYKKVKESYKTRRGNTRTRTSKQVDKSGGEIIVKTHMKKMNLPQRKFMGPSPFLDKRIERVLTAAIIKSVK